MADGCHAVGAVNGDGTRRDRDCLTVEFGKEGWDTGVSDFGPRRGLLPQRGRNVIQRVEERREGKPARMLQSYGQTREGEECGCIARISDVRALNG